MTNEEAIQILKQYLDMDSEVKSEYLEAQRMTIKALEQARWIPGSERLPDKYEDVLITVKIEDEGETRYYTSMGYINSLGEWCSEEWNFPPAKVIAWIPLPEPYKAESEE